MATKLLFIGESDGAKRVADAAKTGREYIRTLRTEATLFVELFPDQQVQTDFHLSDPVWVPVLDPKLKTYIGKSLTQEAARLGFDNEKRFDPNLESLFDPAVGLTPVQLAFLELIKTSESFMKARLSEDPIVVFTHQRSLARTVFEAAYCWDLRVTPKDWSFLVQRVGNLIFINYEKSPSGLDQEVQYSRSESVVHNIGYNHSWAFPALISKGPTKLGDLIRILSARLGKYRLFIPNGTAEGVDHEKPLFLENGQENPAYWFKARVITGRRKETNSRNWLKTRTEWALTKVAGIGQLIHAEREFNPRSTTPPTGLITNIEHIKDVSQFADEAMRYRAWNQWIGFDLLSRMLDLINETIPPEDQQVWRCEWDTSRDKQHIRLSPADGMKPFLSEEFIKDMICKQL